MPRFCARSKSIETVAGCVWRSDQVVGREGKGV